LTLRLNDAPMDSRLRGNDKEKMSRIERETPYITC